MPFGPSYSIILSIAHAATDAFYSQVVVVDGDNVPAKGPLIVAANHWNMTVDPATLACWFPHARKLHFWSKSTLFKNPIFAKILLDSGNIPVDRKNKDNQKLFAGTFDVLKLGEAVLVFPEGTSYTEPRIQAVKDGVSWAALEYAKNIRANGTKKAEDVTIVVAGITHTDKTKYRSSMVVQYGKPVSVEPYLQDFLGDNPKKAVKRLTADILAQMHALTVNAPDWDTLNAAIMARQLLWPKERKLPLSNFRAVTQALVDHFADATDAALKSRLNELNVALKDAKLSNAALGALPIPKDLDPAHEVRLPSRLGTLGGLLAATLKSAIRLPFFALPLALHLPAYLGAKATTRYLNATEAEAFAQNKIVIGLLITIALYSTLFSVVWSLFLRSRLGLFMALGFVWAFGRYHSALIDDNYTHAKKLVATWRVLIGLWLPRIGAAAPGVEDKLGKPLENRIRRVLRLRAEASRDLAAHLQNADPALLGTLRDAGARLH